MNLPGIWSQERYRQRDRRITSIILRVPNHWHFPQRFSMDCIMAPHERGPLQAVMGLIKKTGVSAALNRLALGMSLIALFSAILLLSDLGHRERASESEPYLSESDTALTCHPERIFVFVRP
jgi:hypothetical protein